MMDLFLKSESAMCCPSSATRMKTFLDDNFFFDPEGLAEPEDMHFIASAAALESDFPLEDDEKLIISGLEGEVRPARSLGSAASIPTHAARCWEDDDDDSETSPASDEDPDTGSSGLHIRRGEAAAVVAVSSAAKARASSSMLVINAARLTEKDVPSFLQWFSDLGDRPFRLPSTTVADPAATPTPYSDAFSSSQHQRKSQRSPKEGHVKRPVNCFMLFSMMYRRKFLETNPNANNAGLSKLLSRVWRTSVSEAEKDAWRQEYDTLMKFFKMENPTYKYRPKKKKQIATVISSGHHHHHQQQTRVKNQLGLTVDTKVSQRLPGPALITPPAVVGDASMTSSPRGTVDVDFYLPLTPDEPSTPPAKIARRQKRPATKSTKGAKAAKVPKTAKNAKKAVASKSAAKLKRERPVGRQTSVEPLPHHHRVQQKQVHQQQQQQQRAPSFLAEPVPAKIQLDYGTAGLGRVSQRAGQLRLETTSAPAVGHPLKNTGAELGVKIEPLSPPPESRSPTLQAVWSGECPVVPVLPVPVLLHHHRNPGLAASGVVPALTPSQLLAACGGSLSETSGQPQLLVPVQHVMESQGEVVFLLDRLCLPRPVGAAPAPAHSIKEEQETEILAEQPAYTGEVCLKQEKERVVRVKEKQIDEEQEEDDDIADKDPPSVYAADVTEIPDQLTEVPDQLPEVPDQLTEEELRHNLPPWFTLSTSASSSETSGVGPGSTVPAALVPAQKNAGGEGTTEEAEEEVVMAKIDVPVFTPPPINHVTDFEVEHPGDSLPNEIFDDSMTDDEDSSVVCVAGFSFSN